MSIPTVTSASRCRARPGLVVLAPPSRMTNRGLPASKLRAGGTATVVGYPHRSTEDELRAERIIIDGATVELR